ncbi:hypothetical protein EZ456_04390 [Pedobacter psychrodurus]|uniref:Uncharacterized protein n=1 Tax=Pedobacter psychrodurus TaxID=2530456 RepID=A0A4R0Q9Q6_9SPHI|nr:hypothetical protein [Pedobacter psychrodurus]TCD28634.1 hypothetical protein EZ456_04390 [Pedobacter psychrodurus]
MEEFFHYPDDVIFHGDDSQGFTFLQARTLNDDNEKLRKLQIRLERYYLNGFKRSRHDFNISVMSCIGLEVLGQVMLGFDDKGKTVADKTLQVYKWLDPILEQQTSAVFRTNYNLKRNYPNPAGIDFAQGLLTYADIFRKGLRNSFSHTYRSLGVFLDDSLTELVKVDEHEGLLVINGRMLKMALLREYREKFKSAINNTEPEHRQNALRYFELLIR